MKPLQYAGLVAILLLFGAFGWPTLYDVQRNGPTGDRTNRVTGCRDFLSIDGSWIRQPNSTGRCLTLELTQAANVRAAEEAARVVAEKREAARIRTSAPFHQMRQSEFAGVLSAQAKVGLNLLGQFVVQTYNSTDCELTGLDYSSRKLEGERVKPSEVGNFIFDVLDPREAGSGRVPWTIGRVNFASPGSVDGDPAYAFIEN